MLAPRGRARQPGRLALHLHRLSGLALVLFLPAHFHLLALALEAPARFDAVLHYFQHPLVKLAEGGLVLLLSLHLFGGLRLLCIELLPWAGERRALLALSLCSAVALALFYLLRVF